MINTKAKLKVKVDGYQPKKK